jgi:beta-lactamase regulating signal transducer with metallopeptidase domain
VSRSGEADAVTTPLVFGGRGGFIALPCDADLELCDDDLVHVLLHELAHMRRRDALAAAFVWLGACLFWFHPLVGLVARRLTGLRELACDATVAAHLRGDARRLQGYRATLLRAAEKCLVRSRTAGALGFGSAAALIARLEWLARPRRVRPRLELAGTALVVLLVGAVALPTATRDRAPNRALAVAGGEREAAALVACARATVDAALAGRRPPGCLRLQYSVMALAAQSERTAPRAP